MQRRQSLLTMVMRWSRYTFNFCALIGQNLTGELCGKFMQHFDTCFMSSCDGFNYFFHWMYEMKYSCYQDSSVIHGWFVYYVFD